MGKLGDNRTNMTRTRSQKRYLGPDPDPTVPTPTSAPTPGKMFTEEQVSAIVQDRVAKEAKKAAKEKTEHLARIAQLEPDAQKAAELQVQIEELERKGKSAAELAEMDRKKERAALEEKAKLSTAEAEKWRKKHMETQLERDLMDAASTKEADFVTAQQGVLLLRQGARIGPKLVDGKPTDELETRIKLQSVKDGKPIELDLSPAEAVKVLKDDKSNFNFFNAGVKGGLGGTQTNPRTGTSSGKLAMSQEDFNKAYVKGKLPKN